ncbi:hypothetical protein Nepgr_012691 [Nepenthes gracilis]|uniref:Uncharacterized protein n=1 Tax=Nepenthes gracilis TaxID=150966 RepID=A0AAD3SG82_NEPGR|nr:hypothetical protein Nepgr_012691 [Nepenthes gracilis]
MSNLHSNLSGHSEIGNSFLALLSGPPSTLQEIQQLSNINISDVCKYAVNFDSLTGRTSSLGASIWPVSQETGNQNPRIGVDTLPDFRLRCVTSANRSSSISLHDGLEADRELIKFAGYGTEDVRNVSALNEGCLGSWSSARDKMYHDTNNCVSWKTPEAASFVPYEASLVMSVSPRVFCIGICGDLLLSKTGFLGIVCSCHGVPMSVSKFCEHSGLSNVNPGEAVRMDSGETIAQWRKLYLLKLGIRVPEDHTEWDWPEGFSSTASVAKSDMTITRTQNLGFPDLVGSSAELIKSRHIWNNVFASNPPPSLKLINEISRNEELGRAYDRCNSFFTGSTACSKRHLCAVEDKNMMPFPSSTCLTVTKAVPNGSESGLQGSCHGGNVVPASGCGWHNTFFTGLSGCSKSNVCAVSDNHIMACPLPSCLTGKKGVGKGPENSLKLNLPVNNVVPTAGMPFVYALQHVGNVGAMTQENLKDGMLVKGGAVSSGTELKLGQPSQQSWTMGSTISPAVGPLIGGQQMIFPEQMFPNLGNSRHMGYSRQHFQYNAGSSDYIGKGKFQVDQIDALRVSTGNDACNVEHLKDDLANGSSMPLQIPNPNTSSGGNLHCKEGSKLVNGTQCFIPCMLHSQYEINKSGLVNFPANRNDEASRPLCTSKSAFEKHMEKMETGYDYNNANTVTGSSFRVYAEQMENSGFFIKNFGGCCDPRSGQEHVKKFNSFQLSSMRSDTFDSINPSKSIANLSCAGSVAHLDHVSHRSLGSPMGCGKILLSEAFSRGLSSSTSNLVPNLNSAFFKKDDVGVSPHMLDECLRKLNFRNKDEPYRQEHTDASLGLSQLERIHINHGDLRMQGSLLHQLASEGQKHGPNYCTGYCLSDHASTSLLSSAGCQMSGDVGKMAKASGVYNWEDLAKYTQGFALNPKESDNCCQGFTGPLPPELSSLGIQNKNNSWNMHEKCCHIGPCSCVSVRCNCTGCTKCSVSVCDSKKFNSLKQQVGIMGGEPSKLCALKSHDNSVPIEEAKTVGSNGEVKLQICSELDSLCSQCKDVPIKVKGKMMHFDKTAEALDRVEAEIHLKNCAAKYVHRSDEEAKSFKESELSNISSGCSAPAVTQSSVEANKIDSCTVDAGDPEKANDQVVDEGSAIDKCYSSDDAIDSERGCEYVCSGNKIKSNNEQPLKLHMDGMSHMHREELKHSIAKDVGNLIPDGPSGDECSKNLQKYETNVMSAKGKHKTKWGLLGASLLASDKKLCTKCPLFSGIDTDHNYHMSRKWYTLLQPDQGSSHTHGTFSMDPGSKGIRSSSSAFKSISRKRSLDSIYNIDEGENSNKEQLKSDADFVEFPEVAVIKRSKMDKSSEALKQFPLQKSNCVIAEETLKCSSVSCLKPGSCHRARYKIWTAKPIVCGMYGVISNGEMAFDQIKQPKIISLLQVLKSARRVDEFRNDEPNFTIERESKKTSFSGSNNGIGGRFSSKKGGLGKSNEIALYSHRDPDTSMKETKKTCHFEFGICSNLPKTKCKEIRKRSLSDIFMKGERFSSAELSISKSPQSTSPQKCRSSMERSDNVGGSESQFGDSSRVIAKRSVEKQWCQSRPSDSDALCCVCGGSKQDDTNCLVECHQCLIKVHQACYGISRVPKSHWYCRPCKNSSKDIACVLCGYGGGAMTRALRSRKIVKSLLEAWNIRPESGIKCMVASSKGLHDQSFKVKPKMKSEEKLKFVENQPCSSRESVVHNSIIVGLLDSTVKQWVHVVCGLWTPGTRCPNVDTMGAFDVSGASRSKVNVCSICKRPGGSCIRCYATACSIWFHPWCGQQKGLLQSEVEGVEHEKVGFYARCTLHASCQPRELVSDLVFHDAEVEKEPTCARTEGFSGRKQEGGRHNPSSSSKGKGGCLVPQEQLNAWLHINRQKLGVRGFLKPSVSDIEHDCRKEYARYKQTKRWKHLVVCNSGIHALGLYTPHFIPRGAMVVEYVGEIVGLRVADKREREYQSGRTLQCKSACYFFRIDKEHIIDATCKGGIARFVNHSCLPNCVAKIISIRNEKKVVFLAERDIYPGEEITYDYHFNHEDEGKKIPCFCNSRSCRRYLN